MGLKLDERKKLVKQQKEAEGAALWEEESRVRKEAWKIGSQITVLKNEISRRTNAKDSLEMEIFAFTLALRKREEETAAKEQEHAAIEKRREELIKELRNL